MYSLSVLVFGKAFLNRKLSSLALKQFLNNRKVKNGFSTSLNSSVLQFLFVRMQT